MWILILSVVLGSSNPSPALDHIPNFPTEKSCNDAGDSWWRKVGDRSNRFSYVCVYQPQPEALLLRK